MNTQDDEPDDESNDYGRYKPENPTTGEDELWSIILDLVEQSCGGQKKDELDSWAISAYERVIIALEEAGFVKIDNQGRIGARILPRARKFRHGWKSTTGANGFSKRATNSRPCPN